MTDPKKLYQVTGVGTGGPGGTHTYDLTTYVTGEQAARFILLDSLRQLAAFGESIRDQHPAVYKEVKVALAAGMKQLAPQFETGGGA